MKLEIRLLLVAAFAAFAAPSFAQTNGGSDPRQIKNFKTCPHANELERPFVVSVTFADGSAPRDLHFDYDHCRTGFNAPEGSGPRFIERFYFLEKSDEFALEFDGNDSDSQSHVVLEGRFNMFLGEIPNSALTSGVALPPVNDNVWDPQVTGNVDRNVTVVIRSLPKPINP